MHSTSTCWNWRQLATRLFESDHEFSVNSTAFEIELAGYIGDNAGFESLLRATETNMEMLATKGANRNLPWNHLAWATYSEHVKNPDGSYRFTLLGDVNTIFDAPNVHVGMASQAGACVADVARL